jgi:hypothetical protein
VPILVVRAETYYLPPPPPRGDPHAWDGMPAAERVFHWMAYRLGRRTVIPTGVIPDVPPVYARINQNRWIGDCVCGTACIVSPTDPRYGCAECGYGWVELIFPVFPADVAAVEAEMLLTPQPHLRNWWNVDDPANPYTPEPTP